MEYTDLSSFISKTKISRSGNFAEIMVAEHPKGPVRLLGFATQATKDDFEIWEEGWRWYNELINQIHKQKPTGGMRLAGPNKMDKDFLAKQLYDTYCEAVGGKAFNGDPLPHSSEFFADESKQKQADAWRKAADKATELLKG